MPLHARNWSSGLPAIATHSEEALHLLLLPGICIGNRERRLAGHSAISVDALLQATSVAAAMYAIAVPWSAAADMLQVMLLPTDWGHQLMF
jgi:hypothetical protein